MLPAPKNKQHADIILVNSPTTTPQGCNVYSKPQTPPAGARVSRLLQKKL